MGYNQVYIRMVWCAPFTTNMPTAPPHPRHHTRVQPRTPQPHYRVPRPPNPVENERTVSISVTQYAQDDDHHNLGEKIGRTLLDITFRELRAQSSIGSLSVYANTQNVSKNENDNYTPWSNIIPGLGALLATPFFPSSHRLHTSHIACSCPASS